MNSVKFAGQWPTCWQNTHGKSFRRAKQHAVKVATRDGVPTALYKDRHHQQFIHLATGKDVPVVRQLASEGGWFFQEFQPEPPRR